MGAERTPLTNRRYLEAPSSHHGFQVGRQASESSWKGGKRNLVTESSESDSSFSAYAKVGTHPVNSTIASFFSCSASVQAQGLLNSLAVYDLSLAPIPNSQLRFPRLISAKGLPRVHAERDSRGRRMAYNKKFNPDALPAHAEPEEAAQVLGTLQGNRRQSPNQPTAHSILSPSSNRPSSPSGPGRRLSPAAIAAQQSYQQSYQHPNRSAPSQSSHQHSQYSQSSYQNHNASQNYNESQDNQYSRLQSPPPPSNYGQGPRPTNNGPQHSNLPPRTPAPPDPDSADLHPLFRAANVSQSGVLSAHELGSALVNADYSSFDPYTIKMMMRMFSTPPSFSTITFPEFQNLWRFLAAWRELFERFDEDNSGRVSLQEFSKALVAFGYRLSQQFVGVLYNAYNDKGIGIDERRGSAGRLGNMGQGMSFDLFVQACISLKRMTDVFKGYDEDRDGYVTLSFEEFLTEIIRLRE